MRVPKSDTTHLEKITTGAHLAESITSTTRKIREDEVQQWIDENDPSPIEILKRIAEVSLPHHNALMKIANELEEIASTPVPPQISEEYNRRSMRCKLADVLLETRDIECSINDKQEREKVLRARLEYMTRQRDEMKQRYLDYDRIVQNEKFNKYYDLKRGVDIEKQAKDFERDTEINKKVQIEFSQLWGESRLLRDEISKISEKLEQNRIFHEKFAHERAQKKLNLEKEYQDMIIKPEGE
ncbi:hypothetical protein TRFO_28261 [Tritrichomonas foetus]|uniref:DUF4201 domain-containing protein n=1 Tax=Tritrichomonas foetus TaxID=1144522 RepID=A0A1J4JZ74_9EUKA|nr:hypothetical protein TRFO_28261 [Tritrichomonas foetus]|eukprot:OHT04275.1 hypothetical protein TRFO_28261 [Tritrichomonas foetus]